MAKVGVGVVGCGHNGTRHAEIHASMDASELIGVCDVDPEAAERVAKKHGVKAFTKLEDMLNEPGIEAIDVVTSGSHRDPVVKAAESGRHVMVEVPFAVTLEEGPEEALLASADAATDFFQEHAPADVEA